MPDLSLHDFHAERGAGFTALNGSEFVAHYSAPSEEYAALSRRAGLIDLSSRGRLCVVGADRAKFLHGQVTNDVQRLTSGHGCYAALVNAKAKMESDLFIHNLGAELLLDFEPGLTERIIERLNRYIIADDVQIVDVAPHYAFLGVIGPEAAPILERALNMRLPVEPLTWISRNEQGEEIYIVNNPRLRIPGFDLFVPVGQLEEMASTLERDARWVGLEAMETVRVENAVPRFGADMTETTLPQEAGLEQNAISFAKGCYIGQEIIARIRTYGHVAKALRLLKIFGAPPEPGLPILHEGKNVGAITSAATSPKYGATVALGYVRKECFAVGTALSVGQPPVAAEIIASAGGN
jgi:folate-binding protein YgfZ